jgi:hypothetical protein
MKLNVANVDFIMQGTTQYKESNWLWYRGDTLWGVMCGCVFVAVKIH